jgi:hypothetical protein
MAIRLSAEVTKTVVRQHTVGSYIVESRDHAAVLASASTEEEAEAARLAFERVLLPRFTADEAIAICLAGDPYDDLSDANWRLGMRVALEVLADAGVFVHLVGEAPMADKLNAAGIR